MAYRITTESARERCADCFYLISGEHGEWLCSCFEYEEDIKPIEEVDCSQLSEV